MLGSLRWPSIVFRNNLAANRNLAAVPLQNSIAVNSTGCWVRIPFLPLSVFLTVDKLTSPAKWEAVVGVIIHLLHSILVRMTYVTCNCLEQRLEHRKQSCTPAIMIAQPLKQVTQRPTILTAEATHKRENLNETGSLSPQKFLLSKREKSKEHMWKEYLSLLETLCVWNQTNFPA